MEHDFAALLQAHLARYPAMEPRDLGKLAYQSEFGPEHLIAGKADAAVAIRLERDGMGNEVSPAAPEALGRGLCRYPLSRAMSDGEVAMLARLLVLTAGQISGSTAGLLERLEAIDALGVAGWPQWREGWAQEGYPPVHHSEAFRTAYRPHYRLVRREYAGFLPALAALQQVAEGDGPAVVAIDGRCGSGKTGFAALIHALLPCRVIDLDDYYLPLERREANWMETPGGNMDFERFRREVLSPALRGEPIHCRPYDCQTGRLRPETVLPPAPLTVVAGSYSHHPALGSEYTLKLFLTCSREEQMRRLAEREGDDFPTFQARWMPLEEGYFRQYAVEEHSDLVVDTTQFLR